MKHCFSVAEGIYSTASWACLSGRHKCTAVLDGAIHYVGLKSIRPCHSCQVCDYMPLDASNALEAEGWAETTEVGLLPSTGPKELRRVEHQSCCAFLPYVCKFQMHWVGQLIGVLHPASDRI